MRVFLGTEEVASVLMGLAEGFQSLGHTTTTYVSQKNKFYNVAYDIEKGTPVNNLINYKTKKYPSFVKYVSIKIDARLTPIWLHMQTDKFIKNHDVFVFIWRPWVPEWKIFQRIKKAGKKIICVHLGSDVRDADAYMQEFNIDVSKWDSKYHEDLNERIKKIRYHELYADLIYSVPDQAGLSIRPYKHIYLPLNSTKKIAYQVPARDVPVIIHAPTNSSIKGTDTILATLDQLKAEGHQFELKLLQNLPNPVLLQELTNADILVDELVLHGPGVLSIEAMAAGCAVATKTIDRYKDVYDPPVCIINSETILEKLRFLLSNKEYRIGLAQKGNTFVKEHNDPGAIASNMLRDLNGFQPDYYPAFYADQYQVPAGKSLTRENKRLSKEVALSTNHISAASIKNASQRGLMEPFMENELPQSGIGTFIEKML